VVHAPAPAKKRKLFGNVADGLNWVGARPCTDGDDDSEYGPRGDDQKCVDDGGDYGYDDSFEDDQNGRGAERENSLRDPYDDSFEDDQNGRGADRENRFASDDDVPEGYQEVDMGDPDLDPEGGDWESLDQEEPTDDNLKKVMKDEEREGKREAKDQAAQDKVNQRTATRINRDGNLGPADYHQFWNQDVWHINQAREILEQRAASPKSPEDAEAVRSLLMNGPQVGGGYEKAGKREPGQPGAEDFIDKEDRSPIV
jgi:hypothetical protein